MCDLDAIKASIFKLHPLDPEEWEAFAAKLVKKSMLKGQFLTKAGQVENYLYFLKQGATRNYFLKDGKDFTVDFHFAGEFVTAYLSFITREASQINIELIEDSELFVISYTALQEFYKIHHNGERIGRMMAEFQYTKRLRREMELLSLTAEERYAILMKKNPGLVSTISVKHLSSYFGIQPESLSRIRKSMLNH
jgi:CRP-like cAMP-binding protein